MNNRNNWASALDTLATLVSGIDWQTPKAKTHRANMRSIAIHARNSLTRQRKPSVDDMALAHVLDKFIDWSTDPTNTIKTEKMREAFDMFEAIL